MSDKKYIIYGNSNDLDGIQEAIDLVKENERLKEMKLHTEKYASEMEDKYILEKNKNDKAIEYIENDLSHMTSNGKLCRKHLLDILKGADKE